ncbi:hypothetical protein [Peribacillus loiseleuriae]|uniref:Uncharacterized protein n=1 Tax=Peribacillus loiseleuriae TaxID=1679170 RepID=A0A0K9GPQ5_9BACI|nr:hypothetical protein [Peribacillus loiseleuriae]KMY48623.1 hypothetical protein AC625_03085 [Peribacillus loiseleuriae]
MSRKWYQTKIIDPIFEIKELQQLLKYFECNYNTPEINYLFEDGIFVRSGTFIPIAFPSEVSVSWINHHAHGSDVESWTLDQIIDYFELHVLSKLKRIDKDLFQSKFSNYLEKTYGQCIEEYIELPPEDKVCISCQILIELCIDGELPLLKG